MFPTLTALAIFEYPKSYGFGIELKAGIQILSLRMNENTNLYFFRLSQLYMFRQIRLPGLLAQQVPSRFIRKLGNLTRTNLKLY